MNKWKIAFWVCLTFLILLTSFGLYFIVDQSVSLTYVKEGYKDTENDLENLTRIMKRTLREHK